VLVKAQRAEGGSESVLYSGAVQLWRGAAYIKATRLDASVKDQQSTKVHAEGGPGAPVQSYLQNMRVTSDTLDYDDSAGVARYLGHVHARKQDMILQTTDMTVHFRNNTVSEIVASGGVMVTRGDENGKGERAVYDAAKDVVTLTGNDVEVWDKQHYAKGSLLTVGNKGQTSSIQGSATQPALTKHPVNKPPAK